jgi:transposase
MPDNTDDVGVKNLTEKPTVTCPRCGGAVERIVATDDGDRVEPCGHPVELNYRTARDLRDRVEQRRHRDLRDREAL